MFLLVCGSICAGTGRYGIPALILEAVRGIAKFKMSHKCQDAFLKVKMHQNSVFGVSI